MTSNKMFDPDELGKLPWPEYCRQRKQLAKQFGAPFSLLDREYSRARRAALAEAKELGGQQDFMNPVAPWPHHVKGDDLLTAIQRVIERFVIMPPGAAEAAALWTVGTHALDAFNLFPYLAAVSPTPECGKTTLLAVLGAMCAKPLHTSNVTPSVVFRVIDKWQPTLLIDEADTYLPGKDELRGILNAGHRRGAFVLRSCGENFEPRKFNVFGAKAIALIGRLPPTLASRSIAIPLKRATATQKPERFKIWKQRDLELLARKAAAWAADNLERIASAADDPQIDAGLRLQDNWEPLIGIADVAGGKWPKVARGLIAKLAGRPDAKETANVLLLHDVHGLFGERDVDRLPSAQIVAALAKMEHRPWPEWRHDKPMTQRQLAAVLSAFDIVPGTIKLSNGKSAKGYYLKPFAEAVKHYPTPPKTAEEGDFADTPTQALEINDFCDFSSVTEQEWVTDKNSKKSQKLNGCVGVTDKKGVTEENSAVSGLEDEIPFPDLPEFLDRRDGDGDPFASLKNPKHGLGGDE